METFTPWGRASVKKPYEFFKGPESLSPLDDFLESKVEKAHWLIEFGAVYVNGSRTIDSKSPISSKDILRVHTDPKRYSLNRGELKKRIIFENENYLIVNKPSGLPMHPTLDNLYENLIYGFDFPLYVTHRLDVPTSGVVLVAKTKVYQSAFNKIISLRQIQKNYLASVSEGHCLSSGELVHFMKKTLSAPKILVGEKPDDLTQWQECRLKIINCNKSEINIELLTGRTHQIRAQLAFEGWPILGDEMYGGQKSGFFGLRSQSLSFICPISKEAKSFELTSSPYLA